MDTAEQEAEREPDDLVLQSVVPLLPYYARARAECLSRSWRAMLLRQEGLLQEQQRCRLALARHRGLLLRHGTSCTLSFLDFSDMRTHPLPPLPFAHRCFGATFAFVFCANRRIFAAQCSASSFIQRLYMLDVAAGLFRWQQRFGPPSHLHRGHVGDACGSIQVISPYRCTIVGFKVYVVAERLPSSLNSMDKCETSHCDAIAAAMYDAWEDTWEEIPSPLRNSSAAQLVSLGPSWEGIVARVYENQGHFYNDADLLTFDLAHKQWRNTSEITGTKKPTLTFSTHSYLHFTTMAKDDEAVCTSCGAPTIRRSLKPVKPGSLDYYHYLYKLCHCYSEPQPAVANAVITILSKLRWRVPRRSVNDLSDVSTDDEEDSGESD